MCTLIVVNGLDADPRMIVGANREERYDRPALPPNIISRNPTVLGPMDLEAGGSWLTINDAGVIVAVTNRRDGLPGSRSRGLLVRDVASQRTYEDSLAVAQRSFEEEQYAGCNLLLASSDQVNLFEWDGTLQSHDLQPGIHVIVNEGFDESVAKSAVLRSRLAASPPSRGSEWQERMQTLLTDHYVGVCRHDNTSGTRSSSLVSQFRDRTVQWQFADGNPCNTPFSDVWHDRL